MHVNISLRYLYAMYNTLQMYLYVITVKTKFSIFFKDQSKIDLYDERV